MRRFRTSSGADVVATLLLAMLAAGCGQRTAAPVANSGEAPPDAAPTPAPAPPTSPTAPAHKPRMICRDSQTGAKAKCGAPNAVLVGVETD